MYRRIDNTRGARGDRRRGGVAGDQPYRTCENYCEPDHASETPLQVGELVGVTRTTGVVILGRVMPADEARKSDAKLTLAEQGEDYVVVKCGPTAVYKKKACQFWRLPTPLPGLASFLGTRFAVDEKQAFNQGASKPGCDAPISAYRPLSDSDNKEGACRFLTNEIVGVQRSSGAVEFGLLLSPDDPRSRLYAPEASAQDFVAGKVRVFAGPARAAFSTDYHNQSTFFVGIDRLWRLPADAVLGLEFAPDECSARRLGARQRFASPYAKTDVKQASPYGSNSDVKTQATPPTVNGNEAQEIYALRANAEMRKCHVGFFWESQVTDREALELGKRWPKQANTPGQALPVPCTSVSSATVAGWLKEIRLAAPAAAVVKQAGASSGLDARHALQAFTHVNPTLSPQRLAKAYIHWIRSGGRAQFLKRYESLEHQPCQIVISSPPH